MNSLQRISAEVGPIVLRAMRAEIVHRTRISYHVAEEESTYTAKQKNLSRGNTPDLPLKGVEMTEEEGREREGRTYDVTDGGKDQKWNISNFQPLIFLQYTETFITRAPAGKLKQFRGGFYSTPSYTFCRDM